MYRYAFPPFGALILIIIAVLATLPMFQQQQIQQVQKPLSVSFPRLSTVEEVSNWTLAHIKHAWIVGKSPDSEENVTLLLEKVRERGYAISYCYGIVSVWAYLLYANNISKPFIVIVREHSGYHAVGITVKDDKFYTFYAGERGEIVMIQDPYPDMRGFPADKLVKLVGFIPARVGFSSFTMEEIAVMLINKTDTIWHGPLYVKANGYALLKYRNVKQTWGSQPLTVIVKNGYLAKPSENMYAFEQEIGVKFQDVAIVYAGDWVTILVRE